MRLSKLSCSASSAILIVLLSTGCASHPFAQRWEWSRSEQDADYARISRQVYEKNKAQMEKIHAEYPNWSKAVSDEVLVVECTSDGLNTVCIGR